MGELLQAARDAFQRHDWAAARDAFAAARRSGPLAAADAVALADAAWWLGLVDEAMDGYEEAYRLHLRDGQAPQAARVAIGSGILWYLRGEATIGSGWISRARRLVKDLSDCAEHGYLLCLDVDEALAALDLDTAIERAREVQAIAQRFHDTTLNSAGLVSEGIALITQGRVGDGLAVLDEAMLPVVAGKVSPEFAGNFYCQVMGICHELADVRRARDWTDATERWCNQFTSAVMFAGICRVHRVQLLHVEGEWSRAEQEAVRVCEDLADMNLNAVAEGHYQIGEIRRLRGDLAGAEQSYKHAHQLGRDPQPGLALLRLAQGRADAALTSVQTALAAEPRNRFARARLRAAEVEIALTAGNLTAAEQASAELAEIAEAYGSSGFAASARQARGAVLLEAGRPSDALPLLREALRMWHALDAAYNAARVRVRLARAFIALGDGDAALLELDAAAAAFDRIGAVADSGAVGRLRNRAALPGGLTEREVEVLALIAEGMTNRQVAAKLFLSEKTVARHLANIFRKLGLFSRTAAAAYAFEHGLVARTGH